tara:strand:- start:46 stop:177 length:132 start_codon:yes stop_codon:yes gene_type:complete
MERLPDSGECPRVRDILKPSAVWAWFWRKLVLIDLAIERRLMR